MAKKTETKPAPIVKYPWVLRSLYSGHHQSVLSEFVGRRCCLHSHGLTDLRLFVEGSMFGVLLYNASITLDAEGAQVCVREFADTGNTSVSVQTLLTFDYA